MAQQILKTNDERKTESARPRFVYDFENVDGAAVFLERVGDDVAVRVDREISAAPAIDIVGRDCGTQRPSRFSFFRALTLEAERIINQRGQHASSRAKIFA